MNYTELAGLLPAIILPLASAVQLQKLLSARSAEGVSALSWFLFACANVGAYVFTEKYLSWKSISGFLLTALLNFLIVARVLSLQRRSRTPNS